MPRDLLAEQRAQLRQPRDLLAEQRAQLRQPRDLLAEQRAQQYMQQPAQAQQKAQLRQPRDLLAEQRAQQHAQQQQSQPDEPWREVVPNTLEYGISQGALLGLGDELDAGWRANPFAGGFWDRYHHNLSVTHQRMRAYKKRHPRIALGSELVGAALVPIGWGPKVVKGAWGAALSGLVTGGSYGALSGFGHADGGLDNRLKGTVLGGLVGTAGGAGIGAGVNLGARGLSAGGRGLNYLLNRWIFKHLPDGEAQAIKASKLFANAMNRQNITPDKAAAAMRNLGPQAMFMDTLGLRGQQLGRKAASDSPDASEILRQAARNRTSGQVERMAQDLRNASGLNKNYSVNEIQQGIYQDARPAIQDAYNTAFGNKVTISPELKNIWQTKPFRQAIREGREAIKNQNALDGKITPVKKGNRITRRLLSPADTPRILDATKKHLDDMAKPKQGEWPTHKQQQIATMADAVKNDLDNSLPHYATARGLHKQMKQRQGAVELGSLAAKPHSEDVLRQIQTLPPEHIPLAGKGYAANAIEALQNQPLRPGLVDHQFGSYAQQQALGITLGSKAPIVRRGIARENHFADADSRFFNAQPSMTSGPLVTGDSAASRVGMVLGGAIGHSVGSPIAGSLVGREIGSALMRNHITGKATDAFDIAKLLTAKDVPESVKRALLELHLRQTQTYPALQKFGANRLIRGAIAAHDDQGDQW